MDQAKKLRELMNNFNNNLDNSPDININKKAQILSVSSGKGGVGKTNFSINFAIALKNQGYKVVILDADIGLSNVEILSGTDIKNSISDVVFSDKSIIDVLNEGPSGIKIISGGSGLKELSLLSKNNFEKIIESLNELQLLFDFIIIDTGAGISSGVIDFILASDEVIIIATPDPTSIMDSYVLIKSLNINKFTGKINIVSNFSRNKEEGLNTFNKLKNAAEKFLKVEINYLGYILEDRAVNEAVRNQLPFIISSPNKHISKQIINMALSKSKTSKTEDESSSFGQRLFRMFFKNN